MIKMNGSDLNERFGIDQYDKRIMMEFQKDSSITHNALAKMISKSQPAVGARILKMEQKSLLFKQYTMDLSKVNMVFGIVTLYARNAHEFVNNLVNCPFIINTFISTGKSNVIVWLVALSLEKIEEIVDFNFRSNENVSNVNLYISVDSINTATLPVDLNIEKEEDDYCSEDCCSIIHPRLANMHLDEGVDGGMFNEIYDIDEFDKQIIRFLNVDPDMTHTEIGKRIGKSQPTVGARVGKLREKGLLVLKNSVNFKEVEHLQLVQLSIVATNVTKLIEKLEACNLVMVGFKVTGDKSIIGYTATTSLKLLDRTIEGCLRQDPNVTEIETTLVLESTKDLVLDYNIQLEYGEGQCIGCRYTSKPSKALIKEVLHEKPVIAQIK